MGWLTYICCNYKLCLLQVVEGILPFLTGASWKHPHQLGSCLDMISLKCCLQYRDILSTRIYCLHDRNVIVLFYQPPIEDWLQVVRCSNILGVCVQQSVQCWKLMVVALVVLGGYGLLNIPAGTGIWTLNKISCEPCTGIGSVLKLS